MGTIGSNMKVGFAKLQGKDFVYYMQTYSIILGRNSKKSTVDLDLASIGGGKKISRHHARIFYDFTCHYFALEVLSKNGCLVKGVLHLRGNLPVKLNSQDHLQIGDKEFYFLLPLRSILHGPHALKPHMPVVPQYDYNSSATNGTVGPTTKKENGKEYFEEEYNDEKDTDNNGNSETEMINEGFKELAPIEKKIEGSLKKVSCEVDSQQLQQLEEKDIVSSVATVLSDLCASGEWMPMEKLHSKLMGQYRNVWHHSRVRKYLTTEDWPGQEAKGKPWYGLLMLLRKYPQHFVVNIRCKGRVTLEFVSLVSLLSRSHET